MAQMETASKMLAETPYTAMSKAGIGRVDLSVIRAKVQAAGTAKTTPPSKPMKWH